MTKLELGPALLHVLEPWDFSAFSSKRRLSGTIVKFFSEKVLLFKSDDALTINGDQSSYVLLTTRYVGQSFFKQANDEGHANGAVIHVNEFAEPIEKQTLEALESQCKFILIGPIRNQ